MNNFIVSPTRIELFVPPGGQKQFTISLTNHTGQTATFILGAEDIAPAADSQSDIVLLGSVRGPYSLKNFIHTSARRVTLADGESRVLPLSVNVPADVTSPGLYAAVTVTLSRTQGQTDNPGAKVESRIGVGLLVRTVEHPDINAHLVDFNTISGSRLFWSGPVMFKLGYQNDGNVHVEPAGNISLTNVFGQVSARQNIASLVVLPMATRSETVSLASPLMAGRLVAHLAIEDGFGGHHEERSITLWVIPWQMLLAVGVLIVFALTWPRFRKV